MGLFKSLFDAFAGDSFENSRDETKSHSSFNKETPIRARYEGNNNWTLVDATGANAWAYSNVSKIESCGGGVFVLHHCNLDGRVYLTETLTFEGRNIIDRKHY